MTEHDERKTSLGSYLVGALDPAERAEVDRHLTGCVACREELSSLAGLPGLMSRLTREEVQSGALVPPPTLLPAVLAAVERQRAAEAGRVRRWQAGAGLALVASAAAVVAVVAVVGVPGAGPGRVPLEAAAGRVATGDLARTDKPWGTALHLRVHVPDAPSYVAYAVDAAGRRTVAASWGRTAGGSMDIDGATALRGRDLASVVITTGAGDPLLQLPTA